MSEKRVEITNVLCRQVQLLIKGGATNKEAGYLVGVSAATVSRIRTANYDPFKYQQNTEARRKLEEKEEAKVADAMDYLSPEEQKDEDQVPGQLSMDLQPTYPQVKETDLNKLMRFLAGKMDPLGKQMDRHEGYILDMAQGICGLGMKLDKINDNLCQILRRMDKC